MRKAKSLKVRLALWVLFPTVLIALIDLMVSFDGADHVATLVQDQLLKGSAQIISEQLATVDGGYEISVPPAAFEIFANRYQDRVFYSVRTKSGVLIAGDAELGPYERHLGIEDGQYFATTIRGVPVRVVAFKHAMPSTVSKDYAITQIAQSLQGHDAFRNELMLVTLRQHLFLLAIVSFSLFIAFRWTLRPIIELGETLLNRRPGALEKIDASTLPHELTPIVVALNDYVERLDRTLDSYELFVANTAHYLRTSFAILLSQVNFGRRAVPSNPVQLEILDAIQRTVIQGTKTINQLLVLASLENAPERRVPASPCNLAVVVQSVMEDLAPMAAQKRMALGIERFDDTACVTAAVHLIREVISNVIDNAIQHGPAGGNITVSVMVSDRQAIVRVVDSGPGIPADERSKVFERFYRRDRTTSNSSGLGLSIVKEICVALGGTVTLSAPPNGIGLQVDVILPEALPPSAQA